MKARAQCVEECIHDTQVLREAIEDLSHTQDEAVLRTLDIKKEDTESGDIDVIDSDQSISDTSVSSIEMIELNKCTQCTRHATNC